MTNNIDNTNKIVKKHAEKARHEIRKPEYAVTDPDWIKALLQRGAHGTLATSHENQPFITPLLYYYAVEENAIYFHGAPAGRLRANAAINPQVCFNVAEFGRLLPDQQAIEFNLEYNSVTVFGKIALVTDPIQAKQALHWLMNKYAPHLKPGADYAPIPDKDVKRTAIYRIAIEDISAKQQKEAEDFPGAYLYDYPPLITAQRQPPATPEDQA